MLLIRPGGSRRRSVVALNAFEVLNKWDGSGYGVHVHLVCPSAS